MGNVDFNMENIQRCRCPDCPVYNQCMDAKNERLFCSRGSSSCNFEKKRMFMPSLPQ